MKIFPLAFALVCLVSSVANAACVAPRGSYGGSGAGLSINTAVTPMVIKGIESARVFANYTSNGSGTMTFDINVVVNFFGKITSTENFTFAARGSSDHTWNPTTCQGTLTILQNGSPSGTYWYSVVQSGKEIILTPFTVPSPYTISLKKL